MSNYWNVHCKTCEKYSESDFNRGDHIIRGIAKAVPHIQRLGIYLKELEGSEER